jgi:acid phosphatase
MQRLLLIPFALLFAISCSSTSQIHEHPTLQATLWVQNAAEYDALAQQAYASAEYYLEDALSDSQWTASTEQAEMNVTNLPAAVVLDIDETVLDNSAFQARMIEQGSEFNPQEWTLWVKEAKATEVPGAVQFTNRAAQMGIEVIYLSNRDAATEAETRENLRALGYPVAESDDAVLLQNEKPDWTSAKTERRAFIASQYRILMLFGDDLNDFIYAKEMSEQERDQLTTIYGDYWGKRWFILPNPVYGSWVDAMLEFENGLTEEERRAILIQNLESLTETP